jgi:hypothetical protein
MALLPPASGFIADPNKQHCKSLLKSILRRKIGFRMQRTHGDAAEIQLVQQLTDTALMQLNGKFVHNAISQIGTAPSVVGPFTPGSI